MEVYIPAEAEVKRILLRRLPGAVRAKLGLPPSGADGCEASPEGIWISPVVLRQRGQKHKRPAGNVPGNLFPFPGAMSQSAPAPCPMAFISSCNAAYKILKGAVPGEAVSFHSSEVPVAAAPQTRQDAVVVYRGRVYLSIRKPRRPRPREPLRQTSNVAAPPGGRQEHLQDERVDERGASSSWDVPPSAERLWHARVQTELGRERDENGAASTALQQEADYQELAQEEAIARLKAKLKRSNAALSSRDAAGHAPAL
ncbi:uncharacterized protein si:dkeyp-110g5.4 [Brachionichthys hirsutus]|uniref:uncharacterized protein si:dkeyp-110g5.4 n=1 Tax=Brachionichthys hirsutus TaxID=412623 RepID=UPI003604E588